MQDFDRRPLRLVLSSCLAQRYWRHQPCKKRRRFFLHVEGLAVGKKTPQGEMFFFSRVFGEKNVALFSMSGTGPTLAGATSESPTVLHSTETSLWRR